MTGGVVKVVAAKIHTSFNYQIVPLRKSFSGCYFSSVTRWFLEKYS
jgi:hypothetical protein